MNFFRRLFHRDRPGVFRFEVGGEIRYADPAEIRRRLNQKCPLWGELVAQAQAFAKPLPAPLAADPKLIEARTESADEAIKELGAAIAFAFVMPPLAADGSGSSEVERIGALTQYLEYCTKLMEKTLPLANAPATSV